MHHHFRGSLLVSLALSGSAATFMRSCLSLLVALTVAAGSLSAQATTTAQEAFLDKRSAAPGETVQVYVSSSQPYEVRVTRSFYFQNNQLMEESALLPAQIFRQALGNLRAMPA